MATVDNLRNRVDGLLERVGRPSDAARFAAEFDEFAERDAEANRVILEERLRRACSVHYASLEQAPEIVQIAYAYAAGDYGPLDELKARLQAGHERNREEYVRARMRGWKF